MPELQQAAVRNRLLKSLSRDDFELLRPSLLAGAMHLRQVLAVPNEPITTLYFPESGFVSITTAQDDHTVEVGLVGPEGLAGAMPVLLGDDQSPYAHFVQAAGEALAITAERLVEAAHTSLSLRKRLFQYVYFMWIQTAETAYVNAVFVVEARLARWLLMCQDRLATDDLLITHEFLSMMLGVQRTSVTLTLKVLEGDGLIKTRRGRITVRSRELLLALAGTSYGVPEAEYARLVESR